MTHKNHKLSKAEETVNRIDKTVGRFSGRIPTPTPISKADLQLLEECVNEFEMVLKNPSHDLRHIINKLAPGLY